LLLRNLFVLQALVDVLFGIPLIFATGAILSLYGLSTDRAGVFVSQWLGATFLVLAWISWYDMTDEEYKAALEARKGVKPTMTIAQRQPQ